MVYSTSRKIKGPLKKIILSKGEKPNVTLLKKVILPKKVILDFFPLTNNNDKKNYDTLQDFTYTKSSIWIKKRKKEKILFHP